MIYFKKYDQPIEFIEKVNGHEYPRVMTGEWTSDDDRIEKVWWAGSLRETPTVKQTTLHLYLVLKNGERAEFKSDNPEDMKIEDPNNPLLKQAYEFLEKQPKA